MFFAHLAFLAVPWGTESLPPVRFDPAAPRLGDPVVVYVRNTDPAVDAGQVRLLGYEVPVYRVGPRLLRAIAPIPTDIDPGFYTVEIGLPRARIEANVEIGNRKWAEARLRVNSRFTRRASRGHKARLAREAELLEGLWRKDPHPPFTFGAPVRPVDGRVTALFGTQRIFNGKEKSVHYGLDLDGEVGDPLKAAAFGRAVLAAFLFTSGGTVVLDHGAGVFTLYFHLSRLGVEPGDWVEAGQSIGQVGKTGRVTGAHLHLAVVIRAVYADGENKGRSRAMYVDPEVFLRLNLEGLASYVRPVLD